MTIISLINVVNNDIKTTTYLPVIFLPMALMFWKNFSEAKKEIKLRNL
jgi:hypothetical protein